MTVIPTIYGKLFIMLPYFGAQETYLVPDKLSYKFYFFT